MYLGGRYSGFPRASEVIEGSRTLMSRRTRVCSPADAFAWICDAARHVVAAAAAAAAAASASAAAAARLGVRRVGAPRGGEEWEGDSLAEAVKLEAAASDRVDDRRVVHHRRRHAHLLRAREHIGVGGRTERVTDDEQRDVCGARTLEDGLDGALDEIPRCERDAHAVQRLVRGGTLSRPRRAQGARRPHGGARCATPRVARDRR